MKTNQIFAAALLMVILAWGCNGAKKDSSGSSQNTEDSRSADDAMKKSAAEESEMLSDESPQATSGKARQEGGDKDEFSRMVSSSAAQTGYIDSLKKLIRTAEMKFRATDVVETTYAIEDLVKRHGGWVASTQMASDVSSTKETRISSDSVVESTTYKLTNDIVLRVPVRNLDTLLKGIAPMVDFMDYRNITAEDVTLSFLRKQLEKKRLDLYNVQVSQLTTSGASADRLAAIEAQLEKEIRNDEALLETLDLKDRVQFATVTLHIYGRDKVSHIKMADADQIDAYRPGFGKQLIDALDKGWFILKSLVLFLITIWPILFAGLAVWFAIRTYRKRNKTS